LKKLERREKKLGELEKQLNLKLKKKRALSLAQKVRKNKFTLQKYF